MSISKDFWKALFILQLLSATACQNAMYATTGRMVSRYAVQHVLPSMMQSDDLGMACEAGVSMNGFLLSFERVADRPDRAAVVTSLSAGMCAENEAWEAELRGLRALHAGDAGEVQDARIQEKAAHATAARRFHDAYDHFVRAYGPMTDSCPSLSHEEEALALLGLSAGLLATIHDRAADGSAGVPVDIPRGAARASLCLSDVRWWGVPMALRAAVWTGIPGSSPTDVDPWRQLEVATYQGDRKAVRLARAFAVQAQVAAGHEAAVRTAIARHALAIKEKPADPTWRMLDSYATHLIMHESDKLWTQARGHRTPTGRLGSFWDDAAAQVESDDELLGDFTSRLSRLAVEDDA